MDGEKAAVELHDGVVYLRWIRGPMVTAKDTRTVMAKVSDLCSGRIRPMLVDMARMEGVELLAQISFNIHGGRPNTESSVSCTTG